jgi:hypothetical protein
MSVACGLLSIVLSGCGAAEVDDGIEDQRPEQGDIEEGSNEIATQTAALSATSLISRGARFTSPGTTKADMVIGMDHKTVTTTFNGGDNGFKVVNLDSKRPATLQPIDFGGGFEANAIEWGDFNGDGRSELVVGVPTMADVGGTATGGFIIVHYTATGEFSRADFIRIAQDATADFNPGWGRSFAVGDFNGDGYEDLAVGGGSNRVRIYKGRSTGLVYSYWTSWSGDYGARMAAGDFNCDGFEDLAVAAPDRGGDGMVAIWTGSTASKVTYQFALRQLSGSRVAEDYFGGALAAGNFNNDTVGGRPCADLAVGIPYKDISGMSAAGSVQVYYGANTTAALSASNFTLVHQNVAGVPSSAGDGELFGWQLLATDLNGDGPDDLVAHVYMDVNFTNSPCNGDAAVFSFAGKTGVGVQPAVNLMQQMPGHNGRIGSWEKRKLAIQTFIYSDSPGRVCPPTMVRTFDFAATNSSSLSISSESHYEPGVLGDTEADGLGGGFTHPHAGYIR